jgi:Flp pilus assembly pilin Flp
VRGDDSEILPAESVPPEFSEIAVTTPSGRRSFCPAFIGLLPADTNQRSFIGVVAMSTLAMVKSIPEQPDFQFSSRHCRTPCTLARELQVGAVCARPRGNNRVPDREIVMKALRSALGRLVRDDRGGEVLEYALIAGLIVVAAIAVIGTVGTKVLARWNSLNSSL